ncbi:MAG: TlyA family RNA methyltransferase [Elusimicrobia bacterium]|nr:TlyA family RNA methyltransferase [Elusimicrobiota bacterium]
MPKKPKPRLDELLVSKGLAPSRSKASALIMAGQVQVDGQPVLKASARLSPSSDIKILSGQALKYVSRGGLKLEGALRDLKIEPGGKVALDVGASTGGFTDCLLQSGAKMVYAVDVGKGLIDLKLRHDSRVRLMEKSNARHLQPGFFDPRPSLAVIDVSFISLKIVLPAVVPCLARPAEILALVKPQFEVGRGKTKGGVVKDEGLRRQAIDQIRNFAVSELALTFTGECSSRYPGPEGNVEQFLYFRIL